MAPLLSLADETIILDPMQWQFLGTSPSPSPYPYPNQQYLIYSYAQFSPLVQGYFSFSAQSPSPPKFSPSGISVFLPSNARVGTMNESYLSLNGAESITITSDRLDGLQCGYVVSGDGNNFPSNFIQIPSVPYTFKIPFSKELYTQFACRNWGYADITLSITSIKYSLASLFDLQVLQPIVSQEGALSDSSGILLISPNLPVTINVPVKGTGFNSPETRTTTVTLQAGTQTQSQNISLASIQSAGSLMVPLNVTFGSQDVGLQTITTTVDSGNTLDESNFSNNSASVQVKVIPAYHLVVSTQNPDTDAWTVVPSTGGTVIATPSNNFKGIAQPIDITIRCEDDSHNPAPVGACNFSLALSPGSGDGGHLHAAANLPRPLILAGEEDGLYMQTGSLATSAPLSVNTYGDSLSYTPPEVAGDVILTVTGKDAQSGVTLGNPIPVTFSVGITGLQEIVSGLSYRLTGVHDNTPDDPDSAGTRFHPQNHFVSNDGFRVINIAFNFFDKFQATLGLNDNSLPQGGLFDLNLSWTVSGGHKAHRYGRSADVDHCAAVATPSDPFPQHKCTYFSDSDTCSAGCVLVDDDDFERLCNAAKGYKVEEPQLHCEFYKTN